MASVRNHIAKKISKVDLPEIYQLNRFLNVFPVYKHEIGGFISFIDRSFTVELKFNDTTIPFGIFFYEGKNSEGKAFVYFDHVKTVPSFFMFGENKTGFIDFSNFHSYIKTFNTFALNPDSQVVYQQIKKLKSLVYNVDLPTTDINIITPDMSFNNKVTTNLLDQYVPEILSQELLPEIGNIKTLKIDPMLNNSQVNVSEEYVNEDIKSIKTSSYKISWAKQIENNTIFSVDKTQLEISNLYQIEIPEVKQINIEELSWPELPKTLEVSDTNLISDPAYKVEHKNLVKYLEPVYDLTPQLREEILSNLPDYQKVGAEFLYDNDFVLYNDSFELGKEVQTVSALRMLLRTRKIKKVLILTNEYNNYICKNTPLINQCGLWQTNLQTLLHEYDYKFHSEVSEKDKKNIFTNHIVNGISYEKFEECFIYGLFNHEELNLFDCIIFDDASQDVLSLNCISLLEENAYKNKLWFLSDLINPNISDSLASLFPERKLVSFGRNSNEVEEVSNKVFNYDYYLPMNDDNLQLASEIENSGREVIDDLFGIGNYLRIQPNAFQIIQESQRNTNFAGEINSSNKTELLMYHLSRILERNNRALVYSQFDTGGLKEIEELFEDNNINYVKFNFSDSSEELKTKINYCNKSEETLVYLTNLKPNKIHFNFPKVRHIINFDSWWNPLTRWSLEKKLDLSDQNPVIVYNYYYTNSLESKLVHDLTSKGMYEKNIIGVLTPEKLYKMFDENYWAEFFNIEFESNIEEIDYTDGIFNVMQLVELTKLLLTKLGYVNIRTTATTWEETYHLNAESKLNKTIDTKVIFSSFVNTQTINSFLKNKKPDVPLLILTNGSISHSKVLLPPDVSLINGNLLSRYLELL